MKKLSKKKQKELDTCWSNCLAMWKDIAADAEAFGEAVGKINYLKELWVDVHDFVNVKNNCFFCQWATENGRGVECSRYIGGCPDCPGTLVDAKFACELDGTDWRYEPVEFYKWLKKLDRKRRRQKQTDK